MRCWIAPRRAPECARALAEGPRAVRLPRWWRHAARLGPYSAAADLPIGSPTWVRHVVVAVVALVLEADRGTACRVVVPWPVTAYRASAVGTGMNMSLRMGSRPRRRHSRAPLCSERDF